MTGKLLSVICLHPLRLKYFNFFKTENQIKDMHMINLIIMIIFCCKTVYMYYRKL